MTQTVTISITIELPDGAQVVIPSAGAVATVAALPAPEARPHLKVAGEPRRRTLGKLQRALLEALASRHGRISDPRGGATARLAELAGSTGAQTYVNTTLRRLQELGQVERQITGRRCYRISLTTAGWEAIGQTPPHSSDIDTTPTAASVAPEAPPMPDLGPIGRHPFDPDDVRRRQADLS